MPATPHIVLIIPRGEAVRNFLYSDTLRVLAENARVTLLSVIHDEAFREHFGPFVEQIIPLEEYNEAAGVNHLRSLIHEAHFRWLWSEVARNRWEVWDYRRTRSPGNAYGRGEKPALSPLAIALLKALYTLLGNRPTLRLLTILENHLTYARRPTDVFDRLFAQLQPDLVFNGSHIHGRAGSLPVRVAQRMGIPTAGFIFSWDNLTSRSRIMEPYDTYLVWHRPMREQLRRIYPEIPADRVLITGTPQFDFHFKPEYRLSRDQLADRIGFDPARPFILYTTGIDDHFPEEHRTVDLVIRLLGESDVRPRPQLVVRTYVKGTSAEMKALAAQSLPDVFFPEVQWDSRWYMPAYDDLALYTSLLHEAALGINAASTVSLELLMLDKPVINLGFDPPGSSLPHPFRYMRHIEFDHYRPVAESGAVMIVRSAEDMREMLIRGLTMPEADSEKRRRFISGVFGNMLDGRAGQRVAGRLVELARAKG